MMIDKTEAKRSQNLQLCMLAHQTPQHAWLQPLRACASRIILRPIPIILFADFRRERLSEATTKLVTAAVAIFLVWYTYPGFLSQRLNYVYIRIDRRVVPVTMALTENMAEQGYLNPLMTIRRGFVLQLHRHY
jgi:hypothetical protein